MWVEKKQKGKYKYVEEYKDFRDGKWKKVSVTLKGYSKRVEREARNILEEKIQKKLMVVSDAIDPEMTLEELVNFYREYQMRTVKASTYTRNFYACETLKDILGKDTLVNSLNAKFIKSKLLTSKRSKGTLNEDLVRLKALLRWGYQNDYIDNINYLDKIKPFKDNTRREKLENKFLEQEELQELISMMDCEHWRNLTMFLAMTGMRSGEALALNAQDIDFKNRIIIVNKTFDHVNEVTTTPKTYASNREVFIQDELLKLCIMIKEKREIIKRIMETDTNLFFINGRGDRLYYRAYNKYLGELSKNTLGRSITPHTLRHTHVSLMAEAGMELDAISRRLGHEDSKVTREIYYHVTKKQKEKDREQIKDICLLT